MTTKSQKLTFKVNNLVGPSLFAELLSPSVCIASGFELAIVELKHSLQIVEIEHSLRILEIDHSLEIDEFISQLVKKAKYLKKNKQEFHLASKITKC
jgi:hypothetical protein